MELRDSGEGTIESSPPAIETDYTHTSGPPARGQFRANIDPDREGRPKGLPLRSLCPRDRRCEVRIREPQVNSEAYTRGIPLLPGSEGALLV